MSVVLSLLTEILHVGLMLVAAPTVTGLIAWLEARLCGGSVPPMLAPWRDLVRLTRKTPVISEDASIVSRIAPALGLGATLAAASLVPSFALGMALTHVSDVLVIVSLLTLARLAAGLAALDAGSALPGLAAQNASAMAVLAEPALMLCVVTLGLMGGSFNLDLIIGQQREGLLLPAGASAIVATAMLALILGEASSGVPALEHLLSGVDLAVARMSGSLRRLVWVDLIGGLFLPMGMASTDSGLVSWLIGLAAWAIKLAAFILGLTTIHSLLGRIPRHSLPDIIGVAALLALLAVVIVLASTGSA